LAINYQLPTINYQVTSLEKGLRDFAQFAAKRKGDERSEDQACHFHLLAAFGQDPDTRLAGPEVKEEAVSQMMKLRIAPFMPAASLP
jgi:hypothetical protein